MENFKNFFSHFGLGFLGYIFTQKSLTYLINPYNISSYITKNFK